VCRGGNTCDEQHRELATGPGERLRGLLFACSSQIQHLTLATLNRTRAAAANTRRCWLRSDAAHRCVVWLVGGVVIWQMRGTSSGTLSHHTAEGGACLNVRVRLVEAARFGLASIRRFRPLELLTPVELPLDGIGWPQDSVCSHQRPSTHDNRTMPPWRAATLESTWIFPSRED
jgi:hypothetical protein